MYIIIIYEDLRFMIGSDVILEGIYNVFVILGGI